MEHSDEYDIDQIVKHLIDNVQKPDSEIPCNCLWHTLTSFGLDECICDLLISEGNCPHCMCYGEYCHCNKEHCNDLK